jgi:hypothetical protein
MNAFRSAACAAAVFLAGGAAHAQTVDVPPIKEGDHWVYAVKAEQVQNGALAASSRKYEAWIVRVGSHSFVMANKAGDSNLPPHEASLNPDWSTSAVFNGEEKIVSRPYSFPMAPGKGWDSDSVQPHPSQGVKSLRNKVHYTVLGWEDVTVPAGKFKALKIEMEGNWFKEFDAVGASANSAVNASGAGQVAVVTSQPAHTPDPVGGRMYKLTWYVPEVKRDVKTISEDYGPTGSVMHRTTAELESFKVN